MVVVTSCQEKHISTPPLSPASMSNDKFWPTTSDFRWPWGETVVRPLRIALLRAYLDDMILNDLRDRKRIDIRADMILMTVRDIRYAYDGPWWRAGSFVYLFLFVYFFDSGKLNLNAKSYNIHTYTVIHYAHCLHLIQPTYAFKRSLE